MTIIEFCSNQYKNITTSLPSWLEYVLRGIISIGLVGWLVLGFDWKNVWATIAEIPLIFIMGWLLIWLVGYCLMALRFKNLLAVQDINIGFFYSIKIMFIGAFSGNFMPSSMGGDVFKFVYLARAGYGKSVTSTAVVADRFLHSIATFLFLPFIFTLPGLLLDSKLRIPSLPSWLIGVVIFGVISIAILALWIRNSSLPVPWVSVLITRLRSIVQRLKTIFLKWATHPGTFGFAMILSIHVIFLFSLAGWVVVRGMDIEISLLTWFI